MKISARQVRSILKRISNDQATADGPVGACVAVRNRPGTIDVCRVMTRGQCRQVGIVLERENEGHTNFFEGQNCQGI